MIFLFDGHSIAFRAFYALPETLETKDGFPTNVIHGFLMMLSKLVNNYDVEKIIEMIKKIVTPIIVLLFIFYY